MPEHPLYADMTVPPKGVAQAPQSVDLALTGRCNLSCKYCFYADSMTTRLDLPAERWLDFFSELGGGEDIDGLWRRPPYYKNQPSTAKNL